MEKDRRELEMLRKYYRENIAGHKSTDVPDKWAAYVEWYKDVFGKNLEPVPPEDRHSRAGWPVNLY